MAKCETCVKFHPDEDDESKGVCLFLKRDSSVGPMYWDTKEVSADMEACAMYEERLPLLEQIKRAEAPTEAG